jgi:hypothetical protein
MDEGDHRALERNARVIRVLSLAWEAKKQSYRYGYSDEVVASRLGEAAETVALVRRTVFGLTDNEKEAEAEKRLQDLLDQAAILRADRFVYCLEREADELTRWADNEIPSLRALALRLKDARRVFAASKSPDRTTQARAYSRDAIRILEVHL